MSGDDTASEAVRDARAALEDGQAWRARDLLAAHVETQRDPEALVELARVLHDMGDLPRAGAMWFAAGAKAPEADGDVAAWREQSHDDFAVMWRSLPASVRAQPRPRRIEALRERALQADPAVGTEADGADGADGADRVGAAIVTDATTDADSDSQPVDDDEGSGFDAAWLVAWVLAVAFVVFAVIGFVTALGWIVPG